MPAMTTSGGLANTTRGDGSGVALWAGKAGAVQQPTALQFDIIPPCWSPGHPGQELPEAMPSLAIGCICAAMTAVDTA